MSLRRRIALRLAPELEPDWDYDDDYDFEEAGGLQAKLNQFRTRLNEVMLWGRRTQPKIAPRGGENTTQIDMSSAITALDVDTTPFTTMVMKLRQDGDGPVHSWIEDDLFPVYGNWNVYSWLTDKEGWQWDDDWELESDRRAQWESERDAALAKMGQYVMIAGAQDSGMFIDHQQGTYFRVGDLVRSTGTGEVMRVTAMDKYGPTRVEMFPNGR